VADRGQAAGQDDRQDKSCGLHDSDSLFVDGVGDAEWFQLLMPETGAESLMREKARCFGISKQR
jgi:hypothetical protein